mgnify:CR=1 FL=1
MPLEVKVLLIFDYSEEGVNKELLSCIFWGVVILDLLEIVVRYTPVYPRGIQRRNACLCSHLASLSLPQAAAAIAL